MNRESDVLIVGGGPAGSTTATLLKKYAPDLRVQVLEKARFPRDHVGESQLPMIGRILEEMGCWEKCEAAGFPMKVGATYRWGKSDKLWDFNFVEPELVENLPRPGEYAGVRMNTAWQVDRAVYDEILLDHAESLGCEVHQEAQVVRVVQDEGDPGRINHIVARDREGIEHELRAKHYVDASGNAAVIRKAMGIEIDSPSTLQNVAFWDYWENTEWAVEIGVGGTRVQVLSIGSGWIWFIPLGPTRTSIGFVCPAAFYKESGMTPDEIYGWAIEQEPRVRELTRNATARGEVEATKDWSFLAERLVGANWMLAGECAGFADPILAGGMMLTHTCARHAAYTILELERGRYDPAWLKRDYELTQRRRIKQHIRFADFWYAGNGQFTDLEKHSQKIAKEAGLKMRPKEAFRWLSTGGFTDDAQGAVGLGGVDLGGVKSLAARFGGYNNLVWEISNYNHFELNLTASQQTQVAMLQNGEIRQATELVRNGKRLPTMGMFSVVIGVLNKHQDLQQIGIAFERVCKNKFGAEAPLHQMICYQCLETMVNDGWVKGSLNKNRPRMNFKSAAVSGNFAPNTDELQNRIADGA
ncbi:MAG: NAD(P)/FAD-dependent oxidoreductase [Phycisphaerales bacterium JB047]